MGSQSQTDGTNTGQLKVSSTWGQYNNILFAIQQAISKMQTAALVRIEACTNTGDQSAVGFVDVTPLVNQIDGSLPPNPTPHVTIYGLPYLRMQGGASAIILDPQPGDIGVAVFASRDISKAKSTKAQANPGSYRSYDFADGMYLGGMLNAEPTQYVQFNASGITLVSPTAVTIQAPTITLDGAVTIDGALTQAGGDVSVTAPASIDLTAPEITLDGALALGGGNATITGSISATGDIVGEGVSLKTHVHTSAASGSPTSPPL